MAETLPARPVDLTVSLRKLLEAKDAAVPCFSNFAP